VYKRQAYNDTCIVFTSDRIQETIGGFDLYDVRRAYYTNLRYQDTTSQGKIIVEKKYTKPSLTSLDSINTSQDTSSLVEENPFMKKIDLVLKREIPVDEVFKNEESEITKKEEVSIIQKEDPKDIPRKQPEIVQKKQIIPPKESFKGEVQIGAYQYITSVEAFKKKIPCIKDESIRMVIETVNGVVIHKFILNTIFTSLDEAIAKQTEMIEKVCLPRKDIDKAFIALLDENNHRYGLFFDKDAYLRGKIIYLSS